ncbi:MAG: sodium:proton antiporter [Beijerinckiaceae bacterium]|jgi:monovalent cation:H+ antiporter, CPA1 family|nr:sodium:proton antiporter [Beijerinckiaceae bacterium]
MLSIFDLAAFLVTLTALFAWFNQRYVRLPRNIGLLLMGLLASLTLVLIDLAIPQTDLYAGLTKAIKQIDFYAAVMNGMLGFLLFAGALHVDLSKLRARALPVALMATVGVVISTAIAGTGFWALAHVFGVQIPFIWALVFGALISPTDPVAVLSTLKEVDVPEALETDMAGESLFNDGVGVVIFTIILALAVQSGGNAAIGFFPVVKLFVLEAIGGALLGLMTGYAAYWMMRSIDEYVSELMISIALVMGTYALAQSLHISGPIAVVVAGLLIGERGPDDAMSDETQNHLFGFWTLIDELLNGLLFLLIGLELLVIQFAPAFAWIGLASIALVLFARFCAVAAPATLFGISSRFEKGTIPVLTWGGIRGGISVALALSLPLVDERGVILAATYAVVLWTIVVQGLTLKKVVTRYVPAGELGVSGITEADSG